MTNGTIMSTNIKLNAEKLSRYLDLPAFTTEMDADLQQVDALNKEQERLKSELKTKTDALYTVLSKIEKNYAFAKKTVKMTEPQTNWVAYGIADKK
jgi:phage-related minor tail protein